ncbi:ABC transporter ATP-binding protein [Haloferax mediterranei ATCC 33500]|uniref:ABC transporter ATP-binding protein n=1 Tax=Haloferax mediterranei (strain ATCC 33500 / DSM 1411 / JCM 8866 / NBRC 14739 / NCIMB 2177 / R-4) TaxID=523841 RepID=I3R6B2_HALMT|nr:ABC transporter ATP-binding protein [Haloferax mediterranei]AFK19772.1 ABC-type transport system, ATP-binding protein [Haloferax mediterranei ATCC 33500]AHZ23158.1 ABC transporter ATP-binding protein [Haloferax mediterranei ATCC 33500]EMA00095.1 ABC transporter ATP-binding protein [Haloferax mediterranei ATCC 33500]MDX5987482.1 ABC transporter ATP-binding protein [Haloferax mediterranei ATCC 33500]QCQ73982.1 ABC transporter ATP-binding protein [Haloferax mediterranei ATCC 33500]
MASAIEIRDLTKSYGDVTALDGIDLDVPEGSFFGLLGPNGAGKTTFINILVGLVRKSGGTASVFGYDVEDDYREARDRIGLAPQEFNVDRFFPIREVLEHKAGYHGIPQSEARERADEVLKRVGIYDKRDTRFDWLSGGMKRRFMLARALITDPDLLILDEPTAGVDVQLRHELWETIIDLNDRGTTILLTTHYIEEAERLCDEVAILDSGRIIEVASPEELMDRGTDDIVVQLRDPPTAVPDFAADDDRVEAVNLEGTRLVVTAQQGGLVAPDVVQTLDRAGHEIVDLEISRTSLEEVFVEMTRQGEGRATAEVTQ